MITIIIIIIKIMIMTNRKYWVDVQQEIVSSHGQRNPLKPWLAFLRWCLNKNIGEEAP